MFSAFNMASIKTINLKHLIVASTIALPLALNACKKSPEKSPLQKAWQDAHGLCVYGCPTGAPSDNRIIDRPIYVLSNDAHTKFADWVAYAVSEQTIGHTEHRVWHIDPDLPTDETLSPSDYKDIKQALHMDRGHQAPLASLTGTPDWDMADDLSNITPQSSELNEGPWEHLEQAERNLALHHHFTIHSVTGPLYERAMPKLPHSHLDHTIPSGYWKVVTIEDNGELRAAAFIMDQTLGRSAAFCETRVTVQDIEKRTNLHFFPNLASDLDAKIQNSAGTLLPELSCTP